MTTIETRQDAGLCQHGDSEKIPLFMKIYGALAIAVGAAAVPLMIGFIVRGAMSAKISGIPEDADVTSLVIFSVQICLSLVFFLMGIVLGARLIRNKRRNAATQAEVMIGVMVLVSLCSLMLQGVGLYLLLYAIEIIVLIAISVFVDPTLAEERQLQRRLRDMETREAAENGTLGLDETGKGYISLNFFNLFWIFVVCSFLGLVIETVYHFAMFGGYENRTGMLFGPFSPIYGLGACLMTIALNRFHKKNVLLIFLASAVIGGAFEYLVSWLLQFAFGIVAWDYSGTLLSIDGRTNGQYMAMWGMLGVFWVKLLLPRMLALINMIPWNWRYSVTTVCAALMIANGAMTLLSFDCWYQRMALEPVNTPIEKFCNEHFDNAYMQNRFQSMSLNPEEAKRI